MSWRHVARKDFADAVRSKLFWGLSVLMILLAYVAMAVPRALDSDIEVDAGISLVSGSMLLFIPIIALVVGYMSIVRERESGSIRMVLSLPLQRSEVVFGKFIGRTLVVIVPVVVGFGLAIPFVYLLYGGFDASAYAEFVFRAVMTAFVYVAIAVGVSAAVSTRGKALGSVLGIFVIFEWGWFGVVLAIYYLIHRSLPDPGAEPTWVEAANGISPGQAIQRGADGIFSGISTNAPLVLQEWVSILVVLAWIAVPLAIGYWRFNNANIS